MIYLLAQMQLLGRNGTALYQVEVPSSWEILPTRGDLKDTKEPIASFQAGDVLVTIHNFPFIETPPQAYIDRWLSQIGDKPVMVTATSHGGFTGLLLESQYLIAAAFELAPYYRSKRALSEKTSNWTIKATGSVEQVRRELLTLIHSFETIEGL